MEKEKSFIVCIVVCCSAIWHHVEIIDDRFAGNNLLFVGVVTTKGPCEEVTVRHNGQGHYVVTYRIQDRVKGFIFVKYGDANVPGSPFAISY